MYSCFEDCSFTNDSDESDHSTNEESDTNEDEIDSDIEAALYSQIHHLENPSYEPTIEETENSETKGDSNDKINDGDQSLDSTLNKDKVTPSPITISDDSNECNVDNTNSSDVVFVCEMKNKINSGNECETYDDDGGKNRQKKWWEEFVSLTYNDDDNGDIVLNDKNFEDDKNLENNHKENKTSTKLSRQSVDLKSAFPCKKNKIKQLPTSISKRIATVHPSKRKRNDSSSSEDNAFKYPQHRIEGKNVLINVKPSVVSVDLTEDNDLWQLCSKDIYKNKQESRYYNKQMRTVCNNCSERGHISRDCKKPRKLPICYLCGKDGHYGRDCLDPVCIRCLAVGHNVKQCQWMKILIEKCTICEMMDHLSKECPDKWRRYHMTTTPGPIIYGNSSKNRRVYCYNCGREGHFGHECNLERMDPDTFPTSPFISRYANTIDEFLGCFTSYENVELNRRSKKLAKKKEKCIRRSNAQFKKKRKYLHRGVEKMMKLQSSPRSTTREKQKEAKNKTLSQAKPNYLRRQRKRNMKEKPLLQQAEIHQKNQIKKPKTKQKILHNAFTKSKIMHGDNNRTANDNSNSRASNILSCLVPELGFSMACMRLFSGKTFGNS